MLSISLFVNSAGAWLPKTAPGIHCPTAPIQQVAQVSRGKVLLRAPMMGEKGFIQCHCAEKKAAQTQQDSTPTDTGTQSIGAAAAILLPEFRFASTAILVSEPASLSIEANLQHGQGFEPPTPPPQFI